MKRGKRGARTLWDWLDLVEQGKAAGTGTQYLAFDWEAMEGCTLRACGGNLNGVEVELRLVTHRGWFVVLGRFDREIGFTYTRSRQEAEHEYNEVASPILDVYHTVKAASN